MLQQQIALLQEAVKQLQSRLNMSSRVSSKPPSSDGLNKLARSMRADARSKGPRERTAPDFLIGAHVITQADALLTTDAGFFRRYFAGLVVQTP